MIRAARVRVALTALCALLMCAAAPGRAADAVEVNAILSLTGSGAFLGSEEARALRIVEDTVNAGGGIRGRPLRFVVADDRTDPQTAVQLTNALIAKNANVVIGSSLAATCGAMAPLVKAGPVQYCLSSLPEPAPGAFEFAAGSANDYLFANLYAFCEAHGWTKIALITSTDATGQASERLLDAIAREPRWSRLAIVGQEHFGITDISTAAQIEKLKTQGPDVYVVLSRGTGFNTVLRSLRDAGVSAPVFTAGGNMVQAQLRELSAMMPPGGLYFSTSAGVVPDPSLPRPRRAAQAAFASAFARAHVVPAFPHVLAWDPAMIVVEALRALGPDASAEQIRAHMAALRGYAGNIGTYDFVAAPQRGLRDGSTSIYRWAPGSGELAVVPFTRSPGGGKR